MPTKCQLILGDCLTEMPKIADKSIDMILCDYLLDKLLINGIIY